jgi:hypothetical protein
VEITGLGALLASNVLMCPPMSRAILDIRSGPGESI